MEFTAIRTRLLTESGRFIEHEIKQARAGTDWGRGVRVAEFGPRDEGKLRLLVSAIDRKGRVVVERPVRLDLKSGVRVITVLLSALPKPPVDPCKTKFSRDKRTCGITLKACLDSGIRLTSCQATHTSCIKGAEARRDKCAASGGKDMMGLSPNVVAPLKPN